MQTIKEFILSLDSGELAKLMGARNGEQGISYTKDLQKRLKDTVDEITQAEGPLTSDQYDSLTEVVADAIEAMFESDPKAVENLIEARLELNYLQRGVLTGLVDKQVSQNRLQGPMTGFVSGM